MAEETGTTEEETEGAEGGETTAKTFSQEDVSAIAAREATKAEKALLKRFGVSSPEEVAALVTAAKAAADKDKSNEQKLAERDAELASVSGRVGKYQATVEALLASEMESIPEDHRSLVPEMDDPADRLAYIAKNKHLLTGETFKPAPSAGSGASPAAPAASTTSYEEWLKMDFQAKGAFRRNNPGPADQFSARLQRGV